MIRVREVIIVEGRYDKNTVSQAVDATIIETSGFSIFNDKEKLALLKRLADKRGLILMTDSDSAGFFIRGRLKGLLNTPNIKQAYIPDIYGREKRKRYASSEGKLGVEGMSREVILDALRRAGATLDDATESAQSDDPITKSDMYDARLTGAPDSGARRQALLRRLELPEKLSSNGFLDVLNALYTRDQFRALTQESDVSSE